MRLHRYVVRTLLSLLFVGVMHASASPRARACSCLPSTVESGYNNATDVAIVEVLSSEPVGSRVHYRARVTSVFKGCLQPDVVVTLTTAASEAACGEQLPLATILVGGIQNPNTVAPEMAIGKCGYNREVSQLSERTLDFLRGRMVCCGESCACADNSEPVNCVADPCTLTPECKEGCCVPNYCGGCFAEHYDSRGYAVCREEEPSSPEP